MFSTPSEWLVFEIFVSSGSTKNTLWISLLAGNVIVLPPWERIASEGLEFRPKTLGIYFWDVLLIKNLKNAFFGASKAAPPPL